MTGNHKTLLLDLRERILTITLHRPDKRNALNDMMVNELLEVLHKYKAEPEINVLVLTGSGPSFCAGADLAYLKSLLDKSFQEHFLDSTRLRDMFYELYAFPVPVIALVNGPAIGGGCGLVNVCDFAIAAREATFGYPEVKIGFIPALVSVFLMSSLGTRKARELLLTGRIIGAPEAAEIGLINQVVDDRSGLLEAGAAQAAVLKHNAPSSLRSTKRFCNRLILENIASVLEEAAVLNAESRMHENFREGIMSFLEKRKPEWID